MKFNVSCFMSFMFAFQQSFSRFTSISFSFLKLNSRDNVPRRGGAETEVRRLS